MFKLFAQRGEREEALPGVSGLYGAVPEAEEGAGMRPRLISESEFTAMQDKVRGKLTGLDAGGVHSVAVGKPVPSPYRSKLEASWANYLNGLCKLGVITTFYYEPLNLRLPGKKNFYKPDFLVLAGNGLTFYEIKGRNKSDDRSLVKIKTAAGVTPWAKFVLVKRIGGCWVERTIT